MGDTVVRAGVGTQQGKEGIAQPYRDEQVLRGRAGRRPGAGSETEQWGRTAWHGARSQQRRRTWGCCPVWVQLPSGVKAASGGRAQMGIPVVGAGVSCQSPDGARGVGPGAAERRPTQKASSRFPGRGWPDE